MIKSQKILVKSLTSHRRKFTRSLIAQTVIQTLTFGAAIVTYHVMVTPQVIIEALHEGQAIGWQNAIRNTCPNPSDLVGGWHDDTNE